MRIYIKTTHSTSKRWWWFKRILVIDLVTITVYTDNGLTLNGLNKDYSARYLSEQIRNEVISYLPPLTSSLWKTMEEIEIAISDLVETPLTTPPDTLEIIHENDEIGAAIIKQVIIKNTSLNDAHIFTTNIAQSILEHIKYMPDDSFGPTSQYAFHAFKEEGSEYTMEQKEQMLKSHYSYPVNATKRDGISQVQRLQKLCNLLHEIKITPITNTETEEQ